MSGAKSCLQPSGHSLLCRWTDISGGSASFHPNVSTRFQGRLIRSCEYWEWHVPFHSHRLIITWTSSLLFLSHTTFFPSVSSFMFSFSYFLCLFYNPRLSTFSREPNISSSTPSPFLRMPFCSALVNRQPLMWPLFQKTSAVSPSKCWWTALPWLWQINTKEISSMHLLSLSFGRLLWCHSFI